MQDQTPTSAPPNGGSSELYSWKAPLRPFKKRSKQFFTTVAALAFLLSLIFFTIEGVLAVVVIWSLVFLVWVFSTIAPEEVEHKITVKGVLFAGKMYPWQSLTRFWTTHRFGSDILVIETLGLPGRLEMVINPSDVQKIKQILLKHLDFEEASPTFMDKAASWLSRRVPLEDKRA